MKLPHIILKRLEWLGHVFFYAVLRIGGQRTAYFFLYPVIFCYVTCSRKIHQQTRPYFALRFPGHSWWRQRLDVFFNVLSFGKVLIDRAWIAFSKGQTIEGTFEESEKLKRVIAEGKGVVIVLAHVGNWQSSFADLGRLPVDIHALMEYDEEAVAKHFFDLGKKRPFSIIDVHGFMGGLVEATTALQKGDMILMMGDRHEGGPTATVSFLGRPLRLPIAAYKLATSTGAPVVVLFSAKTGRTRYRLIIGDIIRPDSDLRANREQLARYADRFAAALERYVEKYPYQWYNFFNIWNEYKKNYGKT